MKYMLLIIMLFSLSSCGFLINKIGGDFEDDPTRLSQEISPEAKNLIEESFEGVNLKCLADTHLHVAGLGKNNSGIWINPHMQGWRHPYKRIQFEVYLSASGIKDKENADQEYVERLLRLLKAEPRLGKVYVVAFDKHYSKDGKEHLGRSNFYVPTEYVYNLSKKYPEYIVPIASIHPYKKDAVKEVEYWGKKGVRYIKWLPNAMGMNPNDKDIIPFYKAMKKYDMVLISHMGEEKAVDGEEFQFLGNPLLLKTPLDLGLKVIGSHISSLGECKDFDNGDKEVHCFDLFWRLFNDPKYKKNFFSDLSAITIHTRLGKPIDTLLAHPEIQERIMNGSDYPLPAINFIYRTGKMESMGYITKEERKLIDEIYRFNPLLFDFVLKRTMRHPNTKQKLAASAFELPAALGCK